MNEVTEKTASPKQRNYWKIATIAFAILTCFSVVSFFSFLYLRVTLDGTKAGLLLTNLIAGYLVIYFLLYLVTTVLFLKQKLMAIPLGYIVTISLLAQNIRRGLTFFGVLFVFSFFFITFKVQEQYIKQKNKKVE